MKKIGASILIIFSFYFLIAQSKKEIRKLKIKSITVSETSNAKTNYESKALYDKNGEIVEETDFSKEGIIKSTHKYKRNKDGNVIEETEYDGRNQLIEKKEIKYNALGEKTEELSYNEANKLLKKSTIVYNNQGLKIEKKIYDASNKLTSVKKYQYTYQK